MNDLGLGRGIGPPLVGAVVVVPDVAPPLAEVLEVDVLDADAAFVDGRALVTDVLEPILVGRTVENLRWNLVSYLNAAYVPTHND